MVRRSAGRRVGYAKVRAGRLTAPCGRTPASRLWGAVQRGPVVMANSYGARRKHGNDVWANKDDSRERKCNAFHKSDMYWRHGRWLRRCRLGREVQKKKKWLNVLGANSTRAEIVLVIAQCRCGRTHYCKYERGFSKFFVIADRSLSAYWFDGS